MLSFLRRQWLYVVVALSRPEPIHARGHIHRQRNAGEVVADAVVSGMGSWRFIIIQTCVVALWIACNLLAWALAWDKYPFILLNLVFSTQAAYASPLILMAANRSAAKDRLRDDHEADEVDQLFKINEQQIEILNQQTAILEALHGLQATPDATRALRTLKAAQRKEPQ
jgi:uncharacterized membrane protein